MKERIYTTNVLSDVMKALKKRDRGVDAEYWHKRLRTMGALMLERNTLVELVEVGKQDDRGLPSITYYQEEGGRIIKSTKFESYEMLLGFADGYVSARQGIM